jgi:spore maturation protein A
MRVMNWIWSAILLAGIGFSLGAASGAEASGVLMNAAMDAVALCVRLAGGFAFWSGLMAILEDSGAARALTRALRGALRRLFPGVPMEGEAGRAMAMNLAANMLGLGNAATPMGVRAMRLLGREAADGAATDAMCMFLVINASSIQLIPSSVIAVRAAAGSRAPASILLPTLAATAVSTLVGVAACALLAGRRRHG